MNGFILKDFELLSLEEQLLIQQTVNEMVAAKKYDDHNVFSFLVWLGEVLDFENFDFNTQYRLIQAIRIYSELDFDHRKELRNFLNEIEKIDQIEDLRKEFSKY